MRIAKWRRGVLGVAGVGLAMLVAQAGAARPEPTEAKGAGQAGAKDGQAKAAPATFDRLTFRSGRIIEGEILEETSGQMRVRFVITGIQADAWFIRDEILVVERDIPGRPKANTGALPGNAVPAEDGKEPAAADEPAQAPEGSTKVYTIPLEGVFGEDISQRPLRAAIRDAKKQGAEVIVLVLKNDASQKDEDEEGEDELPEGVTRPSEGEDGERREPEFEGLWRAEQIAPVISDEIEREWETPPKVVVWVQDAIGAAAFLPLVCPNIYMASEAKIGGIGRVEELIRSGDQVVKEKLISARLGHAESLAVKGGYDPRIVRAMARTEYVLSYIMQGETPELLERMPEGEDEVLLTDDGQDDRRDTEDQVDAGEGNDVLTLTPELAQTLGVSRGTVDTMDELIEALGLKGKAFIVPKGGERFMRDWRDDMAGVRRSLPVLWKEYLELTANAGATDLEERTRLRGRRVAKLGELQGLIKRYEEAIIPERYGVPGWHLLETIRKDIQVEAKNERDALRQQQRGGGGGGGAGGRGG